MRSNADQHQILLKYHIVGSLGFFFTQGQIADMDRCLLDVGNELAQLIPEQREIKQKNRELSQQLADLQRKMTVSI